LLDDDGDGINNQQDPDNDSDKGGVSNEKEKSLGTDPLNADDDNNFLNTAPLAVSNITTQSNDKKITLFWSPARDNESIKYYIINFGISPNNLDRVNETPDDRTKWYINSLTNGLKYYFKITPVDNELLKGSPSRLIEATPGQESVTETVKVLEKTGGDSGLYWFIIALLLGNGFLLLTRLKG
jgi:hypothetical protein